VMAVRPSQQSAAIPEAPYEVHDRKKEVRSKAISSKGKKKMSRRARYHRDGEEEAVLRPNPVRGTTLRCRGPTKRRRKRK
jgi:hypothetical protein